MRCQLMILIWMIGTSVVLIQDIVAKELKLSPSMSLVHRLIERGDYDRAMTFLVLIEESSEELQDRYISSLLQSRLYESSQKPNTSIRLLDDFQRRAGWDSEYTKFIVYEKVRLALSQDQSEQAIFFASDLSNRMPYLQANIRNKIYEVKQAVDSQSQLTSWAYGFSSAVIPGLGQILLSRYGDAVSSIFMLSIPGYITYTAKKENEKAAYQAGVFVTTLFYLGNISLAYNLAEQRNRKARQDFRTMSIEKIFPRIDFQFNQDSASFELRWPL
jgi:hypothetical protein